MAKRTISATVLKPSFRLMIDEVLAIVLYEAFIDHATSDRLFPAASNRRISISRAVNFATRSLATLGPPKAIFCASEGGRKT